MVRFDERREHERLDLNAPVVYAFHDSDLFYQARMSNYCKGGMCFISDNAIEPGADIYIMMENFSPDAIDVESYDGYRAEVRWCREVTLDNNQKFLVGVKYYKTIIK